MASSYPFEPSSEPSVDLNSQESRIKIAKMVLKLFNHWQLSQADQLNLLGMSEQSRSSLDKYRKGEKPFPKNRDLFDRVGYLLSIHKALRLLYPQNSDIRYSWVNRRNKAFDNYSPMEIIRHQGILGYARVARYLDFIRGH